jgi:predicted ATPase/class 3 adenylate cyclase
MRSDPPTGVVTLLFTDVEGSTKLLHDLGDDYADALHEHRRVLRATFGAHDGFEVDTQGDAFFVAFAKASDAIAAAAESQRALTEGPIRVRMGLHTGEPRLTEEGYVGLDVHKGARIAAVGHGGQVLLSQATHALVDAPVLDLGAHRLKDLSAPERIYQLEIDGLPSEFPLLKTLDVGINNLPSPRTSFVGRETELGEIERLLGEPECRLLTLVGPGGVGKTRLALEAAARKIDTYPHGVHFVPLASVVSPDLLAPAMAESLQFSIDGAHSGFSAQDQLLGYLSERSTLIILDNFEHLLDGSSLVSRVLERAPQVEILATSRERLNVQSEWIVDVDGLQIEENGNGGRHATSALRLFVERARQVDPGFELGDEDRLQAARICRLVDGMPLGIELASAWVSTLRCAEIADEIERNIDFLATSMRDVPERHRSLRAAFEQSWRLLTDEERDVFERLSVFRGAFTRDAAAAVAGADLRLLSDLQRKSLVRRLELGRYELHELLRQYAEERLAAAPERLEATRERHARFYVEMLTDRVRDLLGERMLQARDELRGDVDNLRFGIESAVTHWSPDEARATLGALSAFFFVHSWYEGAETFSRLAEILGYSSPTALDSSASDVLLSALTNETYLASALGYDEQRDAIALACLPLLRERQHDRELALCLLALGTNDCYRDAYAESADRLEEALAVSRAGGNVFVMAATLSWLGFVRLLLDDLDAARIAFEECREIAMAMNHPMMLAFAVSKLGLLADAESDWATGIRLHQEAGEIFEGIGDLGGTGYTLSRASVSAYGLGDYDEAMRLARGGYEAFEEANHRWGMMSARCRLGFAALALDDLEGAGRDLQVTLEEARRAQASSLMLLALSGIGVLLAREGHERRAAEVLTFVLRFPGFPPFYFATAQPELERLERELPPGDLAGAREAAAGADLDDLVAEALGDRVAT